MVIWIVNFQKREMHYVVLPPPHPKHLQDAFKSKYLLIPCENLCSTEHNIKYFLPSIVGEGLLVGWRKGSLEALDVFRKEPSKSGPDGLGGAPNGSKAAPKKQKTKCVSLSYEFIHSINTEELSL